METTYVVRGHWPFPTDMLRKDQSRAATDGDQAIIDRLSGQFAPDRDAFEKVEIRLIGPNKPNTARWESFKWEVPGDTERAAWKAHQQRQRAEDDLFRSALAKLTPAEREAVLERTGAGCTQ